MFDYNNKNILITGGAGFIGSNLALYIQKNYPLAKIIIFDHFQSGEMLDSGNYKALGHFKNLIGFNGEFISGDINNDNDLQKIATRRWDCIFHQAAISDTTVTDQKLVIQTNTNSFKFFVELAKTNDCYLVYASSAGTYGNSSAPNIVGKGEVPENVYGFSKLGMDNFTRCLLLNNINNYKIIGLRYFNVYGPNEYFKGKTASMILQLGLQMLSNKKVRLFKNGEQQRDFVFIDDVVQANIKAVGARSGVYNVGFGLSRTFNDIVEVLSEALSLKASVEYFENPYKFYQTTTCADIRETIEHLQYTPLFNLEKGIENYKREIERTYLKLCSI